MQLTVSRTELETTIQERLLAGMELLCRSVRNDDEYGRFRAAFNNWQTLNYTFLRSAIRQKQIAGDYQQLFLKPLSRDLPTAERVAQTRAAIRQQLTRLHEVRKEFDPEAMTLTFHSDNHAAA